MEQISIHALVKRATSLKVKQEEQQNISIHALVKRATRLETLSRRACIYFNPRPREEGDCDLHTNIQRFGHFNPRPREEGDRRGAY